MSLKNSRNNRSKQTNEREIIRKKTSFNGGMSMDLDGAKLDGRTVQYMENFVGLETELVGRRGTEIFADRILPSKHFVYLTITNGVFTTSTLDIVVGDIVFIPVENLSYTVVTVKENAEYKTITLSHDITHVAVACYIRGKINATFFHKKSKRLFVLLGNRVYHSLVSKINEYPYQSFSEWLEVPVSGHSNKIANSSSSFTTLWNDVYLLNAGGVFRININEKPKNIFAFLCNENLPDTKTVGSPRKHQFQYTRRYMFTNVRMEGEGLSKDRTSSVVLQETPPRKMNDEGVDYDEIHSDILCGAVHTRRGNLILKENMNPYVWEGKKKQAFRFHYTLDNVSKFDLVFVDLEKSFSFNSILRDIQKGISAIFSVGVYANFVCNNDRCALFIHSTLPNLVPDSITPYENPIDGVTGFGNDISAMLRFTIPGAQYTLISNTGNDLKSVSSKVNGMTHYGVYSTMDISTNFENENDLAFLRVINDPNVYIWACDIPMIKSVSVSTSEVKRYMGLESACYAKLNNVSTIKYDASNNIIVTFRDGRMGKCLVLATIGEDVLAMQALDSDGFISKEETLLLFSEEKVSYITIGAKEAFTGRLVSDTGFTYSGFVIDESSDFRFSLTTDIGRTLFIGEHSTATIVNIIDARTCLITGTHDTREIVCCGINIEERNIRDVNTDEVLASRARSFPLRNRFYVPLPKTSIGLFSMGFLFLANRGFTEVYYGSLADVDLVGYHKDFNQHDNSIQSPITSLSEIGGTVSVKTERSTYRLLPTEAFNGGNPKFGESFLVLAPAQIVSENIGVKSSSNMERVDNGHEIVFTNEPSVKIFNGDVYSENIAYNKIQNTYIEKLQPVVIIKYINGVGILIWGVSK